MIPIDSQNLESYVPVYDTVPETWEEGRQFLVEQLKKLAEAVNVREIGWFLDEELLSGKQFIPGVQIANDGGDSQQFRTILRKVITFPGLTIGLNTQAHGIFVDANFSLIQMFGAATNATALTGEPLPNGADTVSYDATNVYVTVAAAYDRAWVTMEYIQEL
jgi:hypothetical protein